MKKRIRKPFNRSVASLEYRKVYNRERYYFLKQNGVCSHCGQADAAPKRSLCNKCLADRRVRSARWRAMKLQELAELLKNEPS